MLQLLQVWLLLVCGFLLSSCQPNQDLTDGKVNQYNKRHQAAAYNIQLGMAYLNKGDRPRAKKKLLIALELAPDAADANAAMAFFMEKTGEMAKAEQYYRKALSLAPTSGSQLNNYGTFLCRTGNYLAAEKYFLAAVKDINYIHTAEAYENAGLCVAAIPDYLKAEVYFIKALTQDPGRTQSLFELSVLFLKQNQARSALNYLQKYQQLVVNNPAILKLAVEAAKKANDSQAAIEYQHRLSGLTNSTHDGGENDERNNHD